MKHINIKHISSLHGDALRGLDFYSTELGILQGRLSEIAGKNTALEVQEQVDHFQNQFIIHSGTIKAFRQAFHENSKKIGAEVHELAGFADAGDIEVNEYLYEEYLTEEKIFNELRREFNRFAAEWM
jgi:hypothetical protein